MNDNPSFDARAVANLMLDIGNDQGISITNLSLQKLLYFAHGQYLIEHRRPLVDGYFEAWPYGPVHPHVYVTFKAFGSGSISSRATRRDYVSGKVLQLDPVQEAEAIDTVTRVLGTLGGVSTRRLVALSHAVGGPWAAANEGRTGNGRGVRISDRMIVERFWRHKIVVDTRDAGEGPVEEASPT
jgi:uncharacterized phage-associated protein